MKLKNGHLELRFSVYQQAKLCDKTFADDLLTELNIGCVHIKNDEDPGKQYTYFLAFAIDI